MLYWIILIIVLAIFFGAHSRQRKKDAISLERAKIDKMRTCPLCAELVQLNAKLCRFCQNELLPISNNEMEEIELNYKIKIESFDPDVLAKKQDKERKIQSKKDWNDNT